MPTSPDRGGEPGLDGHVDVFQGRVEVELPGLDLPADLGRAPATISSAFRHGDDALPGQHPGVGDGAGDILAIAGAGQSSGMW